MSQGVWRTIHGHPVFLKDDPVSSAARSAAGLPPTSIPDSKFGVKVHNQIQHWAWALQQRILDDYKEGKPRERGYTLDQEGEVIRSAAGKADYSIPMIAKSGDIMREQWLWFGTGDSPYGSRSYVMEKVERILDNINYWEANQLLSRKDLGLTDQLKVFWNSRESYDLSSKAGITLMNSLLVRDWPEARRNLLILKKLYQR